MRKISPFILLFIILSSFVTDLSAQPGNIDRLSWWKEAKFGMFIHWGLYAVPAGIYNGRETDQIGEWIMFIEKIQNHIRI